MTEQERKEFIKILERYKRKFAKNKNASREFLIKVGIYTEKGNLRKNYKHLCIPPTQA